MADFDLDGKTDLVVANGSTLEQQGDPLQLKPQPLLLFCKEGSRFRNVSQSCGTPFTKSYNARALGLCDFDDDGDSDLAVLVNRDKLMLLRNENSTDHAALKVRREGPALNSEPLPQFSPKNFAILRCRSSERRKQFHRGLEQLLEEGAIQAFTDSSAARREPLLAAVGELQFDVVRFRLQSEYDTATDIEWLPFKLARWPDDDLDRVQDLRLPYSAKLVHDQVGHPAVLFRSKCDAEHTERENAGIGFSAVRMSALPRDGHWHASLAW